MIASIEQHVDWIADALDHLGKHQLDRIEPSAGVVVAQGGDLRHGHGFAIEQPFFVGTPENPEAGIGTFEVEVQAFGVVAEQRDMQAGEQPVARPLDHSGTRQGLHFLRCVGHGLRRAGRHLEWLAGGQHVGQHPAPALPARHGAGDRFAAHDHVHRQRGAAGGGRGDRCIGLHRKPHCTRRHPLPRYV